jgi:endonuclease YncB( thermonuclease family)
MTCSYGQDAFRVKRVIDGDTLLLTNSEYVRLIGVDTPETVHPEQGVKPGINGERRTMK